MDALRASLPALSLWLLPFAVLALIIGWETGWGRRIAVTPDLPGVPASQAVSVSLLPDYQIEGGAAARRETVDRPAFVPTRRPAPLAAQETPKPKMARGQFTLTGTAVVDQKQIAFLRETAGGKARTLRMGETINGVTVAEIRPDRVKLTQGDESEELVLKVAAGPRMTIQPPQPGAAVPPAQPAQPGALPVKPPGQPPGAATQAAPVDADATILERRRAARAQQAAQEAAARAGQPTPQLPAPAALPQPTPGTAPATANAPDPRWQDVYRQMQQRQ